jgi:hypothetical protein
LQVEQHQVRRLHGDLAAGIAQRVGGGDREVLERDQLTQRGGGIDVVVDDQYVVQGSVLSTRSGSAGLFRSSNRLA